MHDELYYQIALTLVPDTGPIYRKRLLHHFGSATELFRADKKDLLAIEGIGEKVASQLKNWNAFSLVENELKFIQKHAIVPLCLTSKAYPARLLNCPDPPTLLYWKGTADLNAAKVVSIIGTRSGSAYGKQVTEGLIRSLPEDVLVLSGLAYGIDAIAHRAALDNGLHTVGVLAHGLDQLYPAQNRALAKEMLHNGGLLTEFNQQTKADKYNFPRRNRIVAGMADATVVVETAVKGGSMITADLSFHYNRDLFAVPGRLSDAKSAGCLQLIQQNKAMVYTDPAFFLATMGWAAKKTDAVDQPILRSDLSPEELVIVELLREKEMFTLDELHSRSGLNGSRMAASLLSLELQQLIRIIPGKLVALS